MTHMKVKNLMTPDPVMISPESTLVEAARMMEQHDCGVLPVGDKQNVEGVITDRDIVVRAISQGKDVNQEQVRDYMTPEVCVCDAEATPEEAASLMHENGINRLMVKGEDGQICGILSFGRILRQDDDMGEITQVIERMVGQKYETGLTS